MPLRYVNTVPVLSKQWSNHQKRLSMQTISSYWLHAFFFVVLLFPINSRGHNLLNMRQEHFCTHIFQKGVVKDMITSHIVLVTFGKNVE